MVSVLKDNENVKSEVFAKGLCFCKLFWIFMVGCVFGVLVETLYCLVLGGNFEVRWGVIYGPFNPVYGFGMVISTLLLHRFAESSAKKVFLLSTVFGGTYEYLSNFLQEITLGAVSWNYKSTGFNFGERTNLVYSLCWGVCGLLWIKRYYPKISAWIESFPTKLGKRVTVIMCFFMIFNMLISSLAVWRYSKRANGIAPRNKAEVMLDKVYPDKVIKFVYPNMKVIKK